MFVVVRSMLDGTEHTAVEETLKSVSDVLKGALEARSGGPLPLEETGEDIELLLGLVNPANTKPFGGLTHENLRRAAVLADKYAAAGALARCDDLAVTLIHKLTIPKVIPGDIIDDLLLLAAEFRLEQTMELFVSKTSDMSKQHQVPAILNSLCGIDVAKIAATGNTLFVTRILEQVARELRYTYNPAICEYCGVRYDMYESGHAGLCMICSNDQQ